MTYKESKRIAVFASGYGSNLQALIDKQKEPGFNGEIVLVFSNNKDAFALQRAKKNLIKTECFALNEFKSRKDFDSRILETLGRYRIDLIVLAGYMLLLGAEIINSYQNKILNVHPALLPSFKGTHGIRDAFDYGVKITGVTVHFVDADLDTGPVVLQEAVDVLDTDTIESLEEKIHQVEHRIYPLAVKLFCQDKLTVQGRKVKLEAF